MTIKHGKYLTRCGFTAIVAQIKIVSLEYRARGGVHVPNYPNIIAIYSWDLSGISKRNKDYDLVKEL